MSEKAGRELDALVAVKVMGWKWTDLGPNSRIALISGPVHTWAWKTGDSGAYVPDTLPHFSTDIAAAWDVVEKLNKDGFTFVLEAEATGASAIFGKGKYVADSMDLCGEFGDTAPLAIAKAALKAVESTPKTP